MYAGVCWQCETECRKHEFHYVECKRCAEARAEAVKILTALNVPRRPVVSEDVRAQPQRSSAKAIGSR